MTKTIPSLLLENGQTLHHVSVAYEAFGTLNEQGDNVIVVCHALTGNTNVSEWLGGCVGSGKVLDTDQYFVICANVLGSCYGTTGPDSINPDTSKKYRGDFPMVTVRDSVHLHKKLLDRLGVQKVVAVVGGSMGGMQALEWGLMYPDFVQSLIVMASSGRHSAWCIGISEVQRQAIFNDPNFNGGYYTDEAPPSAGLATARQQAMIFYRTQASFQKRFDRKERKENFEVANYLHYQGNKLVNRFDAMSYVRLTQLMDSHDVARGRGRYEDVLRSISQPTLVVGIDSDILYPLAEQEELATYIPKSTFRILHSGDGHDAFLIEFEQLNQIISPFLTHNNLSYPQNLQRKCKNTVLAS